MLWKIWRLIKIAKFHEPRVGLFLVEFEDENEKVQVLKDGPWHLDKCLDNEQQIRNIYLTEALF